MICVLMETELMCSAFASNIFRLYQLFHFQNSGKQKIFAMNSSSSSASKMAELVTESSKKTKLKRKTKAAGFPRRPLSAYNIFFKVQRQLIITGRQDDITDITVVNEIAKASGDCDKQKKRVHRKSHGKIGFADLARSISPRWKGCRKDVKERFEELARKEKERYYDEVLVYRVKQLHETIASDSISSPQSRQSFSASTKTSSTMETPIEMVPLPCDSKDENIASDTLEPLPFTNQPLTTPIDDKTCEFFLSAFAGDH